VVVVTAAAGGLGHLFVQEALAVGATVAAVAGGEAKGRRLRELGAPVVVDDRDDDWPAQLRAALGAAPATIALDGVGGATGRAALDLLGVGGRLVLFGFASGEPTLLTTADLIARSLTATWGLGPLAARGAAGLRALQQEALARVASGRWRPWVHAVAMDRAGDAHAAIEARATAGKVVLVPPALS
jgi:NADPH2:quinone reductase